MSEVEIPRPLLTIMETHLNVNAFALEDLKEYLQRPKARQERTVFKEQFGDAIRSRALTLEVYERITGEDFDTQEALDAWLQELWDTLFPGEPL